MEKALSSRVTDMKYAQSSTVTYMEKAPSSRVTNMEKASSSRVTNMEKASRSRVIDMEKASSSRVIDMEKHNDLFSFIMDGSQISHAQEELLRHQPFFKENVNQASPPSTTSGADLIIMMSMPQTQPTEKDSSAPKNQDIFLTPLEKSLSLPISDDDPFDNIPQFDWRGDSQATMNVDLGRDFDLGFSNVLLTQEMQEELIERSSRGTNPGVVGDKFKGFERELDSHENISESQRKKLKLSDPKSSFDSPMAYLGIQSQKGKEKLGSEPKTTSCNVEKGYKKHNVFDILKILAKNRKDDDDVDNLSLLEAFKKCGLSFPRPNWWPENDSFGRGSIL